MDPCSIASGNAIMKSFSPPLHSQLPNGFRCAILSIMMMVLALSPKLGFGMAKSLAAPKLSLILDHPEGLPPSLFPFHSYGTDSGLGNLAVRRIAQDSIGFLWVGTEDGLYRYDGDKFSRFDLNSGLPSTWINDILATPEGDCGCVLPRD
jgi:hypothetical protein